MITLAVVFFAATQTAAPEAGDVVEPASPAVVATDDTPGALALSLDVGLDIPAAGRLPMASTRVGFGPQWQLGEDAMLQAGIKTGYSYVAGLGSVTDPVLGIDDNAFLTSHRIPMRLAAALSLRTSSQAVPVSVSLTGSAGADLVLGASHSFGRNSSSVALAPAASVGVACLWHFTSGFAIGTTGEAETAALPATAVTPGIATDVGTIRIALVTAFNFG